MCRIKGVFIKELKNRFLCEVVVDGSSQKCYVPSSSHLSNYLDLTGKEVFLREIQASRSKTNYALQSLKLSQGREIPLEMALSNSIVGNEINRRLFSFLGPRRNCRREVTINGYKCDLLIPETNTIVEIKSILTLENHAVFPTVYSERAIQQFHHLENLLSDGYRVCYIFVSLSHRVKDVLINPQANEFAKAFQICVDKGMLFRAYAMETKDGNSTIKRSIPVIFNNNKY